MSGLVAVKFLRPFANYNKDEIAGFHPERAKAMVDGKVAEYHKVVAAKAQPAKPKADASDTF